MRTTVAGIAACMLASIIAMSGQTPAQPARPAQGRGGAPRPPAAAQKPDADLAQLMRGILFPNSNILFDVQENDPGAPKKVESGPGGNASATYANVYAGWQSVEGAAAAIEESVDLILKAGRVCSNGKPAPVTRPDYIQAANVLREAGRKTLIAAKAKNRDQVSDLTNDLADACSLCHEKYRDKGEAGSAARCTP